MTTFIPYASLTQVQQERVWLMADALALGDKTALAKALGDQAPKVLERLDSITHDRRTLISEYWHMFQDEPFLQAFVLDETKEQTSVPDAALVAD